MHKSITSLLLFVVALAGCTDRIEDRLIQKVKQACSSPTEPGGTVALKNLTSFKWEKCYFFTSWTTADSIKWVIGLAYMGDDVADDYTRMVFTQANAVVHEEDFQSFDYHRSTIGFPEMTDSLLQAKSPFITPDNALFLVEKGKIENACAECFHYSLSVKK